MGNENNKESLWDAFLRIGSMFDYITPGAALVQDTLNDGVIFSVTFDCDSGKIRRLLASYGIISWGYQNTRDLTELMFSVKKEKAQETYNILSRIGDILISIPDCVEN